MNLSHAKKNVLILVVLTLMLLVSFFVRFHHEMNEFHEADTPMEAFHTH